MRPTGYRRLYTVLIGLGAIPFVIWRFRSRGVWPDFSVAVYLMTAYTVLMLVIEYPGPGNRWYWKPVVLSTGLNGMLVFGLGMGAFVISITGMKPPTVMFFGLVAVIMALQSWLRLRLFIAFSPEERLGRRRRKGRHSIGQRRMDGGNPTEQ
jgi:hypothetical protein